MRLDLTLSVLLLCLACGGGADVPLDVEPPEEPAVVEAPAPEEPAPPPSACPEGEPRFRCPVDGGKEILVCGTGWGLQYRFGPPGAPELVYPAQGASGSFTYEERHLAQAMGDVLSFTHEGTTYEVVEMVGSGEEGNFTGVVVLQEDSELARVGCAEEPASDWGAMAAALQ